MAFVLQWIPRVAGMELGNPSINHRRPKNHRISNNNIADSCKQQPGLFPPPNPDFHRRRCVWSDTHCHECLEQSPPPLIHTHLFQSFGDKANSREKEKIPEKNQKCIQLKNKAPQGELEFPPADKCISQCLLPHLMTPTLTQLFNELPWATPPQTRQDQRLLLQTER